MYWNAEMQYNNSLSIRLIYVRHNRFNYIIIFTYRLQKSTIQNEM